MRAAPILAHTHGPCTRSKYSPYIRPSYIVIYVRFPLGKNFNIPYCKRINMYIWQQLQLEYVYDRLPFFVSWYNLVTSAAGGWPSANRCPCDNSRPLAFWHSTHTRLRFWKHLSVVVAGKPHSLTMRQSLTKPRHGKILKTIDVRNSLFY